MAIQARGTVSLADSRVGEIAITKAAVDGPLQTAQGISARSPVTGPEVDVNAKGRLDLRPDGASDLEYRASVTNLETVGRMFRRHVSGNLTAKGA